MANLLYFLPGPDKKPDCSRLERAGLGHLEGAIAHRVCQGPGGAQGIVFEVKPANGNETKVGYYPDEQTWASFISFQSAKPADAGAWFGFYNNDPPRPNELERAQQNPGHRVLMCDRNEWTIPAATYLPRRLKLKPEGGVEFFLSETFQHLQTEVDALWRDYQRDIGIVKPVDADEEKRFQEEHLNEEGQLRLAYAFLALNYRVAPAEINALGLFDDTSLTRTLEAILDVPTFLAMAQAGDAKKNETPGA